MAKIIPRLLGGLGNQLFIYACARRMSLITGSELVLDNYSGFENDVIYKRNYQLHNFNINSRFATKLELFFPFPRITRFLIKLINKNYNFNNRCYIVQEGYRFDNRLLNVNPRFNLYLEGYWQSENYFKDIEDILRKDLVIHPPNDLTNLSFRDLILSASVSIAVHYRFFDLIDNVSNLNTDYYNEAFKLLSEKYPNATYFIFSDLKLQNVTTLIDPKKVVYVNHNKTDDLAYIDLWLMSLCSNFIISNSTFSWWGAYLNSNVEKIVCYPEQWFMEETKKDTSDLFLEDWVPISSIN